MAVVVGNTARSLLGLQRTIACRLLAGKWLQNQLSTSAKLSQTSESSGEKNTKIYEMRTYYVKPKAFGKQIIFFKRPFRFHQQKLSQGAREFVYTARVRNTAPASPLHPRPAPSWKGYRQQFLVLDGAWLQSWTWLLFSFQTGQKKSLGQVSYNFSPNTKWGWCKCVLQGGGEGGGSMHVSSHLNFKPFGRSTHCCCYYHTSKSS